MKTEERIDNSEFEEPDGSGDEIFRQITDKDVEEGSGYFDESIFRTVEIDMPEVFDSNSGVVVPIFGVIDTDESRRSRKKRHPNHERSGERAVLPPRQKKEQVLINNYAEKNSVFSMCQEIICSCPNGVADSKCGSSLDVKCLSCDQGWFLSEITDGCTQKECVCENGTPATGDDCPQHGQQLCGKCDQYFSADGDSCIKNNCVCQNGTPAENCDIDGEERCQICNQDFFLDSNAICHPKCQCHGGNPEIGPNCAKAFSDDEAPSSCISCFLGNILEDGACLEVCSVPNCVQCVEGDENTCEINGCLPGFDGPYNFNSENVRHTLVRTHLEYQDINNFCQERLCICEFGEAAKGEDCPVDGKELCISCNDEYVFDDETSACKIPDRKIVMPTSIVSREVWNPAFNDLRSQASRDFIERFKEETLDALKSVLDLNMALSGTDPIVVRLLSQISRIRRDTDSSAVTKVDSNINILYSSNILDESDAIDSFRQTMDSYANVTGLITATSNPDTSSDNSCSDRFKFNPTTNTCQPFTCICPNGTPPTPGSVQCDEDGALRCQDNKCDQYYHLSDSGATAGECIKNQCFCENGTPVEFDSCDEHADPKCSVCDDGYELDSNTLRCELKKCACINGSGATGTNCPGSNVNKCQSCGLGYILNEKKNFICVKSKCKCQNGNPILTKMCDDSNSDSDARSELTRGVDLAENGSGTDGSGSGSGSEELITDSDLIEIGVLVEASGDENSDEEDVPADSNSEVINRGDNPEDQLSTDSCRSCSYGYTLIDEACVFACTCENGELDTTMSCSPESPHACKFCNQGYRLDIDSHQCVEKDCICVNGVSGNRCERNNGIDCVFCNYGYYLDSNSGTCQENICNCANGTAAGTPSSVAENEVVCPQHQLEYCVSCGNTTTLLADSTCSEVRVWYTKVLTILIVGLTMLF